MSYIPCTVCGEWTSAARPCGCTKKLGTLETYVTKLETLLSRMTHHDGAFEETRPEWEPVVTEIVNRGTNPTKKETP